MRVLQILYRFASGQFPARVGQQVDVFVAGPSARELPAKADPLPLSHAARRRNTTPICQLRRPAVT